MSEVFDGYERQYCEVSANLSRNCTAASALGGEQKKQKLSEIKALLDDADTLIRKMDLEARSLQPSLKATLLAKLREYKTDLNSLKNEVKRIASANVSITARDELLESGRADSLAVSNDQKGRLLMSTERLNQSTDRIKESRKTLLETEDLGVSILQDLHQQRQSLLHAHKTASRENVYHQISEGAKLLSASRGTSQQAFALIIDGKSLAYALDDNIKNLFLDLATRCSSVICCRSSPKQKALVTRLVKHGTGKTTLAIGDGANDVGMLQEADVGVGISGVEGMQAVMSSDIAIAQFRYLERLLLVHGHWCYRRMSSMICYFFYKNITFGFTIFLYEVYASFSGQPAYNDWFLSLYSVLFSALPVIALGVLDQDVSARHCHKFPILYQEGVENVLFSWRRILSWMLNGFVSAIIIFFFCTKAIGIQAFDENGRTAGKDMLGATMYTCVVWVVNLQMALAVRYFTLVQHVAIWGSIVLWHLFLLIYGSLPPSISTNAYKVFIETLAPSISYWFVTFFVVISTLIPYFSCSTIKMWFFPMYHEIVQWMRYQGKTNDSEEDIVI